jgi:hypothetical protein
MRFRTKVLLAGKTATGVEVPLKIVEALGSKKPPVRVTINDYTYRSSVASMNGTFMLGISDVVRRNTGVSAGDTIDVDLELDTEPREVALPLDFAKALGASAKARKFFDSLTYSNRRSFVYQIEEAKTPETRQRRIEKTVAKMKEGRI